MHLSILRLSKYNHTCPFTTFSSDESMSCTINIKLRGCSELVVNRLLSEMATNHKVSKNCGLQCVGLL